MVFAVIGAGVAAVWARSTQETARSGAERQALYAAESALAQAQRQLPALAAAGAGASGCVTPPPSSFQVGTAKATWTAQFCPASQAQGDPTAVLTGTGEVRMGGQTVRKTVQATFKLATAFTKSLYAGQTLTLNGPGRFLGACVDLLGVSGASYGENLSESGCVTGQQPVRTGGQVPEIPFEPYARQAFNEGVEWPEGASAGTTLLPGRWYHAADIPTSGTIEVKGPGFVGVLGDLNLPNGATLKIDDGATLVVTGSVSIDQLSYLQLGPINFGQSGGSGPGMLVAGGNVSVNSVTWASFLSWQDYSASILALTVPQGCQEVWCVPDKGNSVRVGSFADASGLSITSVHLLLYAAPGAGSPSVTVDISKFASFLNGTLVNGGIVSAGDATIRFDPGLSFAVIMTVAPDPDSMLRYMPVIQDGMWVLTGWEEG